jgi:hypothetical protein
MHPRAPNAHLTTTSSGARSRGVTVRPCVIMKGSILCLVISSYRTERPKVETKKRVGAINNHVGFGS